MRNHGLTFIFFCCIAIACFWISSFCEQQTDGFSIARIQSILPSDLCWASPDPTHPVELDRALRQPYHYLGYGGQCYAFVSQDNRYVIKFFKTYFYQPKELLYRLTLPYPFKKTQIRHLQRAREKLIRDFTSYALSWNDLREETGLIYLHLAKTTHLKQKLRIADKLNISHEIDLDHMEFVVQHRANLVYEHIAECMYNQDITKAKQAISSLLQLVKERSLKDCYDEDAKIHRNFGFVGNQPKIIDIGRIVKDSQRASLYKEDLKLMTIKFRDWLQQNHPVLISHLDEALCEI